MPKENRSIKKKTRTDFLKTLESLKILPYSLVYLNKLGTCLYKEGFVSGGGRGRHAPEIAPKDSANILTALAGSESAAKGPDVLKELNPLKSVETGETWESYFSNVMADYKQAMAIDRILVERTFPEIKVFYIEKDTPHVFTPDGKARNENIADLFKITGQIKAGLIQQCIIEMETDNFEWTTEIDD